MSDRNLTLDRDKIKARRDSLGLTQHQLAERSGLSRAIVSLIESGKRTQVEMGTLSKLAAGLGVPPFDLLINPDVQPIETNEDRIVSQIRRMLDEYPHLKEGLAILADRKPRVILRALELALEMQADEATADLGQHLLPAMRPTRARTARRRVS